MNRLRILYKNLHIILSKEISKLKEYMEELKTYYYQQDSKLNEIMEKTTNIFQGFQLVECEISSVQKKVIAIGEKITSSLLKKVFKIKNPNNQIIFIMKILYEILKSNIDINEENSIFEKSNQIQVEEINWEFLKEKVQQKSILLLLSYISETSNLNISNDIMRNSSLIINKYEEYKRIYLESFPEIMNIIDFIEVLMIYYNKLSMLKKLYVSNQNKSNKMETIQSDLDKHSELMTTTKLLLDKVIKDYENYILILKSKDKSNRMIYGYNIIEKYGLYEKYVLSEEYITNNNDYNSEYYSNYGGKDYNNLRSKIRYVIKLKKEYRKKEKFIEHLSSSLITYQKGIRHINRDKFIKAINENRNTSVNKKSSNTNSFSKSRNKNNMSINISNNIMRSMESNNSSQNLKGSFLTNQNNSIFNLTKFNNSPFRNEFSRNTANTILPKKSFVDSYPTFDNVYQISNNKNMSFKDGMSSNEGSQTQTKNTMKTIKNSHEINSIKNMKSKGKKSNTVYAKNLRQKQVNLKLENEQFSICSFCCKNIENKINDLCQK